MDKEKPKRYLDKIANKVVSRAALLPRKDAWLTCRHMVFGNVVRCFLHPLVLLLFRVKSRHKIHFVQKETIPQKAPVIFFHNHQCVHDVPTLAWVVKKQFYVLSGGGLGKGIEGVLNHAVLKMNGIIRLDRECKYSRKNAKMKMIALLQGGANCLIYPEGTWNPSPNLMLLPFQWGVIDIAAETGAPIVPVVTEYFGKHCFASIGKAKFIQPETDKAEAIAALREQMATMLWEIWEHTAGVGQSGMGAEQFEEFIYGRLSEFSSLDPEEEAQFIFRRKETHEARL